MTGEFRPRGAPSREEWRKRIHCNALGLPLRLLDVAAAEVSMRMAVGKAAQTSIARRAAPPRPSPARYRPHHRSAQDDPMPTEKVVVKLMYTAHNITKVRQCCTERYAAEAATADPNLRGLLFSRGPCLM